MLPISEGKDLYPHGPSVSSTTGATTAPAGEPLRDSPWDDLALYAASPPAGEPLSDSPWDDAVLYDGEHIEIYLDTNFSPKPGGGCIRITMIELSGLTPITTPLEGVTSIFVQGKKSACIVARALDKIPDLELAFVGFADVRLGDVFEQTFDMYPYAAVSVLLNPDDPREEKESKPDSSHKDSSSRPVNEEAAINFLKQKLENESFKETIQTAISALQCLYQENVKADEIEVFAAQLGQFERFLSRGDIEMHLAALILGGLCLENAGV